jgi:hypothetical protein
MTSSLSLSLSLLNPVIAKIISSRNTPPIGLSKIQFNALCESLNAGEDVYSKIESLGLNRNEISLPMKSSVLSL